MAKLIIICGLPGSGKTTLAQLLSSRLKIACLHKDTIKESLYGSLNLSTLDDSMRIGKSSIDALLALTEAQLKNDIDVMIESPFMYPEDYAVFRGWQVNYNIDIYSVICSIDPTERVRRFQTRQRHEAHHDSQRVIVDMKFDYKDMPGRQIHIKTDLPVKVLVEEVARQII